jgi:hypothetical protein
MANPHLIGPVPPTTSAKTMSGRRRQSWTDVQAQQWWTAAVNAPSDSAETPPGHHTSEESITRTAVDFRDTVEAPKRSDHP